MLKCFKAWLPNPVGRAVAQHPLEDEFGKMLGHLFVRPPVALPKPVVLTEDVWSMQNVRLAIGRLQLKKTPDHCGVSATLLPHVPKEFLTALLRIYNSAGVPDCWRTCFQIACYACKWFQANCQLTTARFLRTWFLVISSIHLSPINPKNTTDSAQNIGLTSSSWQPMCFCTTRQRTEYPFGWKVRFFQKHLTVCIGPLFHMIWMLSSLCGGHSGEVRGKWGSRRNCPQLSKNFWRETRVCPKSSCIFRSAAVGYESSEARRCLERIWFRGWRTCAVGSAFCQRDPIICKIICWNSIAVKWFGHCTVASWLDTQCEQHGSPNRGRATTTAFTVAILEDTSRQKWWSCILTAQGSKLHHRSRHPRHFSLTLGSCKTTKYRLGQGWNTRWWSCKTTKYRLRQGWRTRWRLPWNALHLDIGPCIKTVWWTWTCCSLVASEAMIRGRFDRGNSNHHCPSGRHIPGPPTSCQRRGGWPVKQSMQQGPEGEKKIHQDPQWHRVFRHPDDVTDVVPS